MAYYWTVQWTNKYGLTHTCICDTEDTARQIALDNNGFNIQRHEYKPSYYVDLIDGVPQFVITRSE